MPVCHDRKLAFCHIPRTGGVSISTGLNLKVKDKHFPASWYRKTYPDYTLFATLRPYEDRIRSTFGWEIPEAYLKHAPNMDLLVERILKTGSDNIGLMIKPNEYFLDCDVDFLLRFEHLQDDLNAMLTKLGHNTVILTPCNSFKK
jgi:hypothetical protein